MPIRTLATQVEKHQPDWQEQQILLSALKPLNENPCMHTIKSACAWQFSLKGSEHIYSYTIFYPGPSRKQHILLHNPCSLKARVVRKEFLGPLHLPIRLEREARRAGNIKVERRPVARGREPLCGRRRVEPSWHDERVECGVPGALCAEQDGPQQVGVPGERRQLREAWWSRDRGERADVDAKQ